MTDFADWIRTEIKHRGWPRSLHGVTTGRRKPGMRFFLGIARAFEMPLAEVVVIWEAGERESRLGLELSVENAPLMVCFYFPSRHSSAVKRCVTLLLRTAMLMARWLPARTHSLRARVMAV